MGLVSLVRLPLMVLDGIAVEVFAVEVLAVVFRCSAVVVTVVPVVVDSFLALPAIPLDVWFGILLL